MSEVRQLRKAGELEQALALGERLLAESPEDLWLKRDMTWVYHDLARRALEANEAEQARRWIQAFDALAIPDDDALAHDRFNIYRWKVHPAAMEAEKQSSRGHHIAAFRAVDALFDLEPMPKALQVHLGWLIYRSLKQEEEAKRYQHPSGVLERVQRLGIHEERPLFGLLLTKIIKMLKTGTGLEYWDAILSWAKLPDALEADDFVQQTLGTRKMPALADTVLNGLLATTDAFPDRAPLPEAWVERVIQLVEQHGTLNYTRYRLTKWLLSNDRQTEAQSIFLPFARGKQTEFWVWELMAELVPMEEGPLRLACLARALICHGDEDKKVRVYDRFIQQALKEGKEDLASAALSRLIRVREQAGYRLLPLHEAWRSTSWASMAFEGDWQGRLTELARDSASALHADVPVLDGVIVHVNEGKRIAAAFVKGRIKCLISLRLLPVGVDVGMPVKVRLDLGRASRTELMRSRTGGPPLHTVWAMPGGVPGPELVRSVRGKLRRTTDKGGQPIGFVESCFVPPNLLQKFEVPEGRLVVVQACYNPRPSGQEGWLVYAMEEAIDMADD